MHHLLVHTEALHLQAQRSSEPSLCAIAFASSNIRITQRRPFDTSRPPTIELQMPPHRSRPSREICRLPSPDSDRVLQLKSPPAMGIIRQLRPSRVFPQSRPDAVRAPLEFACFHLSSSAPTLRMAMGPTASEHASSRSRRSKQVRKDSTVRGEASATGLSPKPHSPRGREKRGRMQRRPRMRPRGLSQAGTDRSGNTSKRQQAEHINIHAVKASECARLSKLPS